MADVIVDSDNKNSKELLAQGVRAYVLQDFNAAVAALSKASELMVSEHGDDLHESLGDVYLYYGKALLGLSRDENEALGDAVPRNNDEESDEEEDGDNEAGEGDDGDGEEDNGGAETMETEKNGEAEKNAGVAEGDKMDTGEKSTGNTDEKKDDVSEVGTNGTSKAEPSGSSAPAEESDDKAENDDEPTDLQVAWEVLELAKKIFQKLGDSGKKNLAETLTVLGEISLESENFEAAIVDIKDGLQIQKELFEKDSRTVAETYYKLGMAYSTNSQIEEAVENYKNSLEYLQNRIKSLEKKEDKKSEEEIEEIKSLIPDIEEKIVDMKSYKDEALKKIVSAVTEAKPLGESSTSEASSSKPVTNISHLVKRKRKLDEISDEKESAGDRPAKK